MKKWKVLSTKRKIDSEDAAIEQLFRLRKVEDRKKFLNSALDDIKIEDSGIDKKELKKAISRINEAIEKNEKIIILGDYDVDGICSLAILWETIYKKHKNTFPYIPDRFTQGYGISLKSLENLFKKHPDVKLIITVDNGIVANKSIDFAKERRVDVIISDHHVASKKLPSAYAIVHTTSLCGAGVAWMLVRELGFESQEKINEKLELAALATVADLVPLIGLNRAIVKLGLEYLRKTKRVGLNELFKIAGMEKSKIDTYHIGYIIGPRLNASGRIGHAIESLRLICSNDKKFTANAALLLENTNRKRQQMVKDSVQHAKLTVTARGNLGKIIVVSHESYSEGIVGLISSKLVDEYYRPALAISVRENISKGSARSISGVNIIELLRSVSDNLIEVGGHPMAAGFSIRTERIEEFYTAIEGKAMILENSLFDREMLVDLELPLDLVTESLFKKLQQFSPFGMGNPIPVFVSKNVLVKNVRRLGKEGSHLKLDIENNGKHIEAIGFNMGDLEIEINDKVDIAFTIDINEWRNNKTLQLKIKDIKTK